MRADAEDIWDCYVELGIRIIDQAVRDIHCGGKDTNCDDRDWYCPDCKESIHDFLSRDNHLLCIIAEASKVEFMTEHLDALKERRRL